MIKHCLKYCFSYFYFKSVAAAWTLGWKGGPRCNMRRSMNQTIFSMRKRKTKKWNDHTNKQASKSVEERMQEPTNTQKPKYTIRIVIRRALAQGVLDPWQVCSGTVLVLVFGWGKVYLPPLPPFPGHLAPKCASPILRQKLAWPSPLILKNTIKTTEMHA